VPLRLKGVIQASRQAITLEDHAGQAWVLDYNGESPYKRFAGREVVVVGEAYEPDPLSSHMIGTADGRPIGHFQVSFIVPLGEEDGSSEA
jgi:hypothetical protein